MLCCFVFQTKRHGTSSMLFFISLVMEDMCLFASDTSIVLLLQLLTAYFGKEEELTEADKFLRNFIASKAWIDKEDTDRGHGDLMGSEDEAGGEGEEDGEGDGAAPVEEDEEFLEEVDRFEAAYNFR